eukprot:12422032-Karenia_brevis.AAC.1
MGVRCLDRFSEASCIASHGPRSTASGLRQGEQIHLARAMQESDGPRAVPGLDSQGLYRKNALTPSFPFEIE